ncbi:RecB family exonuclease [Aeromicrobium sp. Root495]|uniref:RecB family exonuclease n=1 Tax=Aeromicrobium sp. Root495 TaxID=1736550 RepID=UPI0009E8F125|nr:PD-(D/E)XK nuclease family protein [Aeromicrobium sp. Root495]
MDVAEAITHPAAEVREVRMSLSPSRAGDFQTCPLLYRYRTVDRLPEPPSPAAARGTLVHAVLEDLFDAPATERTLERAVAMLPGQWAELLEEEPRLAGLFTPEQAAEETAWLSSAVELLGTYFRLEDPRWLEPADRELRVDHVLESGLGLGGIVDRVDVAPDGRIRVVDYKTGRSPDPRYEDKALFQMKFYALVLWRTRGVVPTLLQLLYLADGTVLQYEPTEDDLRGVERKVQALWDAISASYDRQDFQPRPSALCRWCAHTQHCPEVGGTLLPFPEVRIVPVEPAVPPG